MAVRAMTSSSREPRASCPARRPGGWLPKGIGFALCRGHRPATRRSARSAPSQFRCDVDAVTAADVRGAEIVIHCAAFVELWGAPDAWDRINVQGTRRMLGAAQTGRAYAGCSALPKQAGVRRFIHIGTE